MNQSIESEKDKLKLAKNDDDNKLASSIQDLFFSITELVHNAIECFLRNIDLSKITSLIPDYMIAIKKLQDHQYVLFNHISKEYMQQIIDSKDVEATIIDFESKNSYERSATIISSIGCHEYIQAYKILYDQTVSAYASGQFNVAALGILALTDSVLSIVADDIDSSSGYKRCQIIYENIDNQKIVPDEEIEFFSLGWTLGETYKTLYKRNDFSGPEPVYMNRNRIMHGRSTRIMTKIDCIKLWYFLFVLILIKEYEKKHGSKTKS